MHEKNIVDVERYSQNLNGIAILDGIHIQARGGCVFPSSNPDTDA